MASDLDQHRRLLDYLAMMAPGTPLRDGFERILRGRTGALGRARPKQDHLSDMHWWLRARRGLHAHRAT